jgi:hypothetical protein
MRTEYLFMDRAHHLSMSRIYLAAHADRIVAALIRGVPEEDDEEEEQEDDQEESEEDYDEGEGSSE